MALNRKGFLAGAAVGVGLTAAVAVGAGVRLQIAAAQQAIQPVAPPTAVAPTGAPMSFANIIERVAPAVVSIEVTTHVATPRTMQIPGLPFQFNVPNGNDDDSEDGDGDDGSARRGDGAPNGNGGGSNGGGGKGAQQGGGNNGGANRNNRRRGPEAMAAGSGFFISANGYIVTNNHVVENADSIKVSLSDQRELTAHLIGRDPLTDIAVIKVDGDGFPFVNFEAGAKPRVGDWVVAIGNPYTLGGTVTAGIVSAEQRNIPGENVVPFLQIDAPINRGNSGGPTFDVYGRVIGVNTAIFSETGGSVGIGFAIPANIADNISHQLIARGSIRHGFLGVSITDVTGDIAASQGIQPHKGAMVGEVTPGGPGAQAGVQAGDIITRINGAPVHSASDLSQVTAMAEPGDMLHLQLLRNGRDLSLTAKAGTRPSAEKLAANSGGDNGSGTVPGTGATTRALGMSLAPLSDATRQQYNIQPNVKGVVVTRVAPESSAANERIRPGVVIYRAGEHDVASAADVLTAVADARRANRPSVLLFVNAGGRPGVLAVKLDSGAEGAQK